MNPRCPRCGTTDPDQFCASTLARPGLRCRPCQTDYMREYRASRPSVREQDRRQVAAYNAALKVLRERHRPEFDAIYTVLLEAESQPKPPRRRSPLL